MEDGLKRRDFLKTLGLGATALSLGLCSGSKKRPTNFVVIFVDDQGYADLGCYGAQGFSTPNIDRLASQGMRFTSFYVAQAVCSASRAALLTGCYPNRVSILGALGPQAKHGLNSEEETIAEVLKKKGYTCGVFGKWHLGHRKPFLPLQHGFDEYFGLPYSNDMWPMNYNGEMAPEGSNKARHPWPPLIDGNETVSRVESMDDQDNLTTQYTQRAVQFIKKNKDNPFFLYVPHSMVHVPLGVSDRFRGKSEQGLYGDVMMEIDWSVGEITKTLQQHGLEENTFVMYTSDNGPWLNFGNHAGSVGPLREGKGTSWEGGVRVPCIIKWPGVIAPGTECDKIAATMDVLPTLASIAGAPLPAKRIDGVNILPLLKGESNANPREHMIYYYGKQLQAVRIDRWKLHFPHNYRSYEGVEPGMDGLNGPYARGETGLELYDLEEDIGEKNNVVDIYPEIVKKLQAFGERVREDLGDGEKVGKGIRPAGKIQENVGNE
ncbi:MAG: sulfatase-like hydrolase/transferase [Candidatus Aminicenantaceae bacterium]